ncbi:unnamed protein product [Echinostoma caproni]|uniref:DNA methyltransferase 1-associated protein 1 n=1 Tax=Echinostoma caproni TaxID=27848 RepID=A0A183BB46_9TREM|nr:unnamed protein product [Echinostoma caproni]
MNATDVMDILDIDESGPKKGILDKEALLSKSDKKKSSKTTTLKRPENIPRELWGLQSTLNSEMPPLMPVDDAPKYCQPKAVIGDDLILYHWRREKSDAEDPTDEYPFARYNKHVTVPEYTTAEYETMLQDPKWTEAKTAHLMELARRFDLRFVHMRDRWDLERFPGRPSIEDLKERYYGILITLDKSHVPRYTLVHSASTYIFISTMWLTYTEPKSRRIQCQLLDGLYFLFL